MSSCAIRLGSAAVLTAVLLSACNPGDAPRDPMVAVHDGAWPAARLHWARGHSWVLAETASYGAVADGMEPMRAGVTTIFYDTNGNGRLDALAEPSAPCWRDSPCAVDSVQAYVHRLTRVDPSGVRDTTYLVAQAYDPITGHVDEHTTLCATSSGDCFDRSAGPFAVEASPFVVEFCQEETFVLESAHEERVVVAHEPTAMNLDATLQREDDGTVSITTLASRRIDRVMVSLRSGREVHLAPTWTSEHTPGSVLVDGDTIRGRIPVSALAECGADCQATIQVLHCAAGSPMQCAEGIVSAPVPHAD